LLAPGLERQVLQRATQGDSGVVDKAVEAAAVGRDLLGDRVNLRLIGHVQDDRHKPFRAALPQPASVIFAAHSGVHPMAEPVQAQRACLPDASRSTGHQD